MDTDSSTDTNVMYVERLQQAVRVMEGLSDAERANFNISVIAVHLESGISACIAGLCGLDPWFQAQGLITTVAEPRPGSIGTLSLDLVEFFGTGLPFFRNHYGPRCSDWEITVDDAIAALRSEIASFGDSQITDEAAAH